LTCATFNASRHLSAQKAFEPRFSRQTFSFRLPPTSGWSASFRPPWAVQRVFETGDVRHYNYLAEKIRLVVDLYDRSRYEGYKNYYDKKNPLTAGNKIGPPVA